jgi:hypothetical protein
MSDIVLRVQNILDCASITFSAKYIAQRKREGWDCFEWECSFKYRGKEPFVFPYFKGMAHVDKFKKPTPPRFWQMFCTR